MKKLLAVLLAAMLVLSGMVFAVAADEAVDETVDETVGETTDETAGETTDEALPESRVIPIFSCDQSVGAPLANRAPLSLDTENKTEGDASLTYTFTKNQELIFMRGELGYVVDATGMDSLEMDIYISDLQLVEFFKNPALECQFEISSSGTSDVEEQMFLSKILFSYLADWQVGWNHIVFPFAELTDAARGANLANINYFGFYTYYYGVPTVDPTGMTFKIDNVCFSNAQAAKDAMAIVEAEPVIALAQELSTLQKEDVNADNYEELRAKVNELDALYGALSVDAVRLVDDAIDGGVRKVLRKADQAVTAYEESLIPDDPTDTPDDPTDTPDDPTDTPDDPTDTPDDPTDTPDDPTDTPDDPTDPEPAENNNMVIIIVVAAVVVVAAGVCLWLFVFKKKK